MWAFLNFKKQKWIKILQSYVKKMSSSRKEQVFWIKYLPSWISIYCCKTKKHKARHNGCSFSKQQALLLNNTFLTWTRIICYCCKLLETIQTFLSIINLLLSTVKLKVKILVYKILFHLTSLFYRNSSRYSFTQCEASN